jgi:hypothetical protein
MQKSIRLDRDSAGSAQTAQTEQPHVAGGA